MQSFNVTFNPADKLPYRIVLKNESTEFAFSLPSWDEAGDFLGVDGINWLYGQKPSRFALARQKGIDDAVLDAESGYYNRTPLSGEWAGESINEKLGDLVVDTDDEDDSEFLDVLDAYEDGYHGYFHEHEEALTKVDEPW